MATRWLTRWYHGLKPTGQATPTPGREKYFLTREKAEAILPTVPKRPILMEHGDVDGVAYTREEDEEARVGRVSESWITPEGDAMAVFQIGGVGGHSLTEAMANEFLKNKIMGEVSLKHHPSRMAADELSICFTGARERCNVVNYDEFEKANSDAFQAGKPPVSFTDFVSNYKATISAPPITFDSDTAVAASNGMSSAPSMMANLSSPPAAGGGYGSAPGGAPPSLFRQDAGPPAGMYPPSVGQQLDMQLGAALYPPSSAPPATGVTPLPSGGGGPSPMDRRQDGAPAAADSSATAKSMTDLATLLLTKGSVSQEQARKIVDAMNEGGIQMKKLEAELAKEKELRKKSDGNIEAYRKSFTHTISRFMNNALGKGQLPKGAQDVLIDSVQKGDFDAILASGTGLAMTEVFNAATFNARAMPPPAPVLSSEDMRRVQIAQALATRPLVHARPADGYHHDPLASFGSFSSAGPLRAPATYDDSSSSPSAHSLPRYTMPSPGALGPSWETHDGGGAVAASAAGATPTAPSRISDSDLASRAMSFMDNFRSDGRPPVYEEQRAAKRAREDPEDSGY